MKRIGITASKISKGNIVLYNLCVILISVLFSLLVFVVAGSTVLFALGIIKFVGNATMGIDFEASRRSILVVCMASLTVVITLFNLFAILMNLKSPGVNK